MIVPLILVLGLLLSGYGLLRIWRAGRMRLARDHGTLLRIALPPQGSHPVLTLQHKDEVLFGPVQARWSAAPAAAMACGNADRNPALPGGDVPAGRYRVLDAADISGAAEPIRRAFGAVALILRPEDGGRDILLHGVRRHGPGSGGIVVLNRSLDALIQQLGDPRGLHVEIERRSIRREGWGGTGRALSRSPSGSGTREAS